VYCGKTDFVNLSSHMRYVHGKTVLASGTNDRKKPSIAKSHARHAHEHLQAYAARDDSSDMSRFQPNKVTSKAEGEVLSKTPTIEFEHKNRAHESQNISDEEDDDVALNKERMKKVHFAMLETYYKLPLHKKQKYLLNESSRPFLIFLQELCLNAMRRSFEFDKEELLTLNCDRSYLKLINGLLPTKQLRNLLSSLKMVKAIDCLIPFPLKWWNSLN
jgi:hypothetical protein